VASLLKDLDSEISLLLSPEQQGKLRGWLTQQKIDTSADLEIQKNNAVIMRKTLLTLACIAAAGFLGALFVIVKFKLDFKEIFSTAAWSLLAIAAVEFIFVTFFAQNYKTLDENYVKLSIIKALRQYHESASFYKN
jgi:glucan phosphoethanolaminetransferase (alkaline phosphatase superfamily)